MFYWGLGGSLREGMESFLYMIPLGGAYDVRFIPIPALLGEEKGKAVSESDVLNLERGHNLQLFDLFSFLLFGLIDLGDHVEGGSFVRRVMG